MIPSVTAPFCGACDRTRITADGQMRTCLFSRTETDLRTPLREGASGVEVARLCAALPSRPRRTLRITLFATEELGSGGGHAYARAPAAACVAARPPSLAPGGD